MTKRSRTPPPPPPTVTRERASRLCRLVRLLGTGTHSRQMLLVELQLDVRGFYRDLKTLREVGLVVELKKGIYRLKGRVETAINRLPLPDMHLTLGEAEVLSEGRTKAHRKLRALLKAILEE